MRNFCDEERETLKKGQVWYLMGEAREPQGQIVFKLEVRLRDMGREIKEWVVGQGSSRELKPLSHLPKQPLSVFMGISDPLGKLQSFPAHPGEGHWDVGFRCASDLSETQTK
jgi:hypothetical protein